MVRNLSFGSSPLGFSRRVLARALAVGAIALCGLMIFSGLTLNAQSTSGGGLRGLITDPQGAVVRNAQVTATNTATGVQTTTKSNNSGQYVLQPLQAGNYTVEVVAKGFQRLQQENVTVDNAQVLGLPLKLTVGGEDTTITVTDAPPFLNTTDASLGGTIENELYSELPLSMNGGPRDPTAFQYLMPGVQENPANAQGTGANNGNSGIYGGTGQTNLNQNYVEGIPVTNVTQGGSNTGIASSVSVDAVDQFSVVTSNAGVQFGGAGSTNYTIKAGGNQFHGSAVDYFRNTLFDTWGYFSKQPSAAGIAEKPGEHQNQYDLSLGGPILHDKLFFFVDYSGFHYTKISNTPQYINVPTCAERGQAQPTSKDPLHCGPLYSDHGGDFTDALGTTNPYLVNPLTGNYGSRAAFQGLLNGVPTYNVIELQYMSPISEYLQKALPAPQNLATFSNYLAVLPQENSDYSIDARLDFTLNGRNKFSLVALAGNTGFGGEPNYSNYNQLPVPYAAGKYTNQKSATGVFSYTLEVTPRIYNTFKYGYIRSWGQGFSLTKGTPYSSSAAGINNLPIGNATDSMPSVSFTSSGGPPAPANWASTSSTGPLGINTYDIVDNLSWIKGRHNITLGAQIQWLQANAAGFGGYSRTLSLSYNNNDDLNCISSSVVTCPSGLNGDVYAAFLVGAVNSSNVNVQSIQDVGGRFRPMAPYIQDSWQVSPKLTLNLGLRYDYLQPYHEVQNRIAFLNSAITNPIVGIKGVVEYGGVPNANTPAAYAPYMCHCRTPVHPYNKNIEPNLGFSYAVTPTTVLSGGYSIHYTLAGGSGGGSGTDSTGATNAGASTSTTGTGNNAEFNLTTTWSQAGGTTGNPAFFLNPGYTGSPNNATYNPQGGPNNTPGQGTQNGSPIACVADGSCSPYTALPPWTAPGVTVNPLQSTGNYDYTSFFPDHLPDYSCSTSGTFCQPGNVNYADPYYGGRGPQFINYNFSIQHMINRSAVLTIAYAGSQTHFLPGGAGRGYAQNRISPDYTVQYGGQLAASCGSVAACKQPYPLFAGPSATFAQSLRPFPQFNTFTDLWGDTGNAAYNSLQISVVQRQWHNLTGTLSYTRAKTLDDTGTHRTQYGVGPQDGNFPHALTANQVDRSLSANNQTNAFNVTWVYKVPFGRGQAFFATNRLAGLIAGGWQLSGIYRYRDGTPLQITNGGGCLQNAIGLQGTCFPDATPGFDKRRVRMNGRWGRGPGANAGNFQSISYINSQAFSCPDSSLQNVTYTCGGTAPNGEPNQTVKLGNVARSAPYGLTGPGWWEVQLGIRRTFNVMETARLHLTFEFEADVDNATNSTFFNLATTNWDTSGFGTVSGQNKAIQPRDWQFVGRFRF
ncbi:MAG TPA: carboxypeptidase-like regulatory domain-containing protein [Acidobacteriaceae bacterium]|nr:carboxypeptidase-like regulatory domain-containing protein [Acidobacteriaceae bacterium]